ncbi:bZIP transcription factor 44-like [Wolffia australiana]
MASCSGSGTSYGSEEDMQQQATDMRKQKRKLSNRESARRSRQRKQKHLDDLTAQVARLREENGQIRANLKMITQQCVAVEAENSVMRAQAAELGGRLGCLAEVLRFVNHGSGFLAEDGPGPSPWSVISASPAPISANFPC